VRPKFTGAETQANCLFGYLGGGGGGGGVYLMA